MYCIAAVHLKQGHGYTTDQMFLFLGILEPLCHILPVDDIPNGLYIVRTDILVLKIVGMLPDINAK